MTARWTISLHDCILPSCGLRARIFYPCIPSGSASRASWFPLSARIFPNDNSVALAEYLNLPYIFSPLLTPLQSISLPFPCDECAAPGPFPLMLFSHGLGGSLGVCSTFCATVAATGRIVIAVEHGDGSAFAAYIGESRVRVPYKHISQRENDYPLRHQQLQTRVEELVAVLGDIRAMASNERTQKPLTGHGGSGKFVDFSGRIAADSVPISVAGHSFGGGTALAFCFAVQRGDIKTTVGNIVCLDPWLCPMGRAMVRDGDIGDARVLFVDQGQTGTNQSTALRRMLRKPRENGQFWSVKVLDGMHNNATDFAIRLPRLIASIAGLSPRNGDPEVLMKAQNDAVVAFFYRDRWCDFWNDVERGNVDGLVPSLLPDAVVADD